MNRNEHIWLADYYRRGKLVADRESGKVEQYATVNLAKKAVRALQNSGKRVVVFDFKVESTESGPRLYPEHLKKEA